MQNQRPRIFDYLNYRTFLKDMVDHKKMQKNSKFSYRNFSRMAGLKSINYLKLVLDGERNLSAETIHRFAKGFELKGEEREFFELLVNFDQATTSEQKKHYYERIAAKKSYFESHPLEVSQYEYFSRWYWVALRELVNLKNFSEDPDWINQRLKTRFSDKEIKEAINRLLELGLLGRDEEGKLYQSEAKVSTNSEVFSLAVLNFHYQMLRRAGEALEKTPRKLREISTLTLPVSLKEFEWIKARLDEVRREIHAMVDESEAKDAVYQLNLQFFNLTEVPWS